jgi:hypothetical protein
MTFKLKFVGLICLGDRGKARPANKERGCVEGSKRGERGKKCAGEGVCLRERVRGSEMNSGMQIGFRKVPYDTFFLNLLSAFLKWPLLLSLNENKDLGHVRPYLVIVSCPRECGR